jgi:hypothetical protein
MNKYHLQILVIGLIVIGVGFFFYKLFVLGFPLTPYKRTDVWNAEARISFDAVNRPVKLSFFIPQTTHRFIVVNENFISRGYGLTTQADADNRRAIWSIQKAWGQQTLYYRAVVQKVHIKSPRIQSPKPPEPEMPEYEGVYLEAARALLAETKAKSADQDTLIAGLFKRLNEERPDNNVSLLLGKSNTQLKKLQTAEKIMALDGTPARVAHGIILEEHRRTAPLIHWLQVYTKDSWKNYHPVTGEPKIPSNYLCWWHGNESIARLEGGQHLNVTLSVNLNQEEAISASLDRGQVMNSQFLHLSLLGLPIQTQNVYRVLLLVPIGAFILVILRNVIGIRTFGTFMPILIALAFRETQILWGVFLFTLLITLGLSARFYFENLKLLLVPRLASILTIVVLLMVALTVITHKLGLERGLGVALFPMVIITMTIERMCIVWEERGAAESIKQGIGSLVVAALACLVMTNRYAEHIVFIFPEVLLVSLAGTLLLGRYSGYRLLELYRFKVLAKDKEKS